MTPNELRAAAERLRQHKNCDVCSDSPYYNTIWNILSQCAIERDTEVCADAYLDYLATLPPDADEPISEEWLTSTGWTRVQLRLERVVDGRTIELYDCVIADSPMRGLLWNAFWRVPCNPDRQQWPIPLTKRQQLRALLAALGVEANKKVGA